MHKIVFSFIIPHYNLDSSLLQRCLDSIPHRSDVEIIVVDDCSPFLYGEDGTILENKRRRFPGYSDPFVDVVFLSKNIGPGAARNLALQKAKGEWVFFADADDYYETTALEKLMNLCFAAPYDVIWFGVNENFYGFEKQANNVQLCNKQQKLSFLQVLGPWNKVIKRNFLVRNNIIFDELYYCEDQIISARLVCESNLGGIYADTVYHYISTDSSLSKTEDMHRLSIGFHIEMNFNKYLKAQGVLSLKHRNPLLGGLLFRIYSVSPWRYRFYIFQEFLYLGWKIAWADYRVSCIQRHIRPNFFYQLTDPIRVWLGTIRTRWRN